MRRMQHNLKPVHGREIFVEIIDGSWDWQSWTASLSVSMAGLTITEKDEAVNHSFRIVQRGDLARYTLGKEWRIREDWIAAARGN